MRFIATGIFCMLSSVTVAQTAALPKGTYSFGPDQTIADISALVAVLQANEG